MTRCVTLWIILAVTVAFSMSHILACGREDVRQHSSKKDCWVIINNTVYNVTEFLNEHPGGASVILQYAGRDATKAYEAIHSAETLSKHLTARYVRLASHESKESKRNNSQTSRKTNSWCCCRGACSRVGKFFSAPGSPGQQSRESFDKTKKAEAVFGDQHSRFRESCFPETVT